jgi:hypothetical protein
MQRACEQEAPVRESITPTRRMGGCFTANWLPSYTRPCVFQKLSWREGKVAALGLRAAESWILQNITMKSNLPAEKSTAHPQAKYK